MPRKLVVCIDGTWNDPTTNTNVYKIKNRIRPHDRLVYYDPGVGTGRIRVGRQTWIKNVFDRVGGGAFGAGLSGNVQEAYRWICEQYEEGDELWFFGFSRGAFTARSTVGFIRNIRLLRPPIDEQILQQAYNLYRKKDGGPDTDEAKEFRRRENTIVIEHLDIAFVGVWDTVGALGVPGLILGPVSRRRWGFHDQKLSRYVRYAYQALGADELRAAYLASLWYVQEKDPDDTHIYPEQKVEQVWFAGEHSEIGGAEGEVALRWMAEKAAAAGLDFDPPVDQWSAPRQLPLHVGELPSLWWRFICGRATRAIGDPHYAAQSLSPSLDTAYADNQDYRRENLVAFKDGKPLEDPIGRRWWFTLPGALRYYLSQYGNVKKLNVKKSIVK